MDRVKGLFKIYEDQRVLLELLATHFLPVNKVSCLFSIHGELSPFDFYRLELSREPLNCPVERNILIRDKVSDILHCQSSHHVVLKLTRSCIQSIHLRCGSFGSIIRFRIKNPDLDFSKECAGKRSSKPHPNVCHSFKKARENAKNQSNVTLTGVSERTSFPQPSIVGVSQRPFSLK